MKHIFRLLLLTILGLLAVACGAAQESAETNNPAAVAEPTATLALPPTATPEPPTDSSSLPEPYGEVGNTGQIQFLNSYATW